MARLLTALRALAMVMLIWSPSSSAAVDLECKSVCSESAPKPSTVASS